MLRRTSLGSYYFVKYMNYKQNVNDCELLEHMHKLHTPAWRYRRITQRDVNCSKLATDENQESKTFSWQEASSPVSEYQCNSS